MDAEKLTPKLVSQLKSIAWLVVTEIGFRVHRSVYFSTFARALSWSGRLWLPFGIVLQYLLYVSFRLNPLSIIILNSVALASFGTGQILLSLHKLHEMYERPRVRDVHEIRRMIHHLAELRAALEGTADPSEIYARTQIYVAKLYRAACSAICRDRHVIVTLMVEAKDEDGTRWLTIRGYYPRESNVDEGFRIPIMTDKGGEIKPVCGKGVAAFVYGGLTTIYVPDTSSGLAKLVIADKATGHIRPANAGDIWLPNKRTNTRAGSIFTVPVHLTTETGPGQRPLGVLNFETKRRNGFADADLHLACTFGNLLAQGFWLARTKMEAISS